MGKGVAWITGPIVHMGTHQMENHQFSLLRGVLWQCVVCLQHTVVEAIGLSIANVELSLAQFRIVQEEPSTEVVDGLLCLGQELVGDKCHVVAGFAEDLREEGLVAPLATIANGIEGEHVLEHEARQVP